MTLYLKYRPQTVSELDLTAVREALQKAIATNNLPHAFLFSGQKGTGKTSSARILAKVVNCEKNEKKLAEPCNECETCVAISKGNHIDVIEMDAASHRGIDDIRSLKENIALSPQSARKKVYIIDEAHMLTTEAANAFLKTLEEPPAHVLFILATTNPEKLPDTIHSRLATVDFTKATSVEVARQLSRVIKGEKFEVEDAALEVISQVCDGSFRDAVKTLEQLVSLFGKVSEQSAREFLFQSNILKIDRIFQILEARNGQELLAEIERVVTQGGSIKLYIDQLSKCLHQLLLSKSGIKQENAMETTLNLKEISQLLEHLQAARSQLSGSFIPQLSLEIELLKWIQSGKEVKSVKPVAKPLEKSPEKPEEKREVETKRDIVENVAKTRVSELNQEVWQKLLTQMKSRNASIEALLRASQPMQFDGSTLTLGVYYQFHKERLESGTNRKTLEEVIATVFGSHVRVDCQLTEKPAHLVKPKETVLTDAREADIINAAKEIFG